MVDLVGWAKAAGPKPLRMCVEKSKSGDAKPLNVCLSWGIKSFTLRRCVVAPLRETIFLLPRHTV